ncbi:MAG: hypothetical protein H6619_04835 [Deltaproteobacteria bacterium]|nr:hypothetical protein [Deltaproteobacteria bacterium]
MKQLLIPVLVLAALAVVPSTREFAIQSASDAYHDYTEYSSKKEVHLKGLKLTTESEVQALLPQNESVWWWQRNRSEIRQRLASHKYISDVKINSCERFAILDPRCFVLSIVETKPQFITTYEDQNWLVGSQGDFIMPVSDTDLENDALVNKFGRLRLIKGLSRLKNSSDLISMRLAYAKRVMDSVEQYTSYMIQYAELKENGEIAIKFSDWDFTVVFSFSEEDQGRLKSESLRLKTLLNDMPDKEDIETIDLAFRKMAVVRKKDDSTQNDSKL